MSNYTKSTNFATKDALSPGNPSKIVKGTEIDTEFNNIAIAIATKSDASSPTFSGTVTAPDFEGDLTGDVTGNVTGNVTGTAGSIASTNWVVDEVSGDFIFKYDGTSVAKLDSSGNLTVIGEVIAFGTL